MFYKPKLINYTNSFFRSWFNCHDTKDPKNYVTTQYKRLIPRILHRLYSPDNWGKTTPEGTGHSGVIFTKFSLSNSLFHTEGARNLYDVDPDWSLLNFVNSHYTCMSIICNYINYLIFNKEETEVNQIDFYGGKLEYEYEKLKRMIMKHDKDLFLPGDIFNSLTGAIGDTRYLGDKAELETIKLLKRSSRVGEIIQSHGGMKEDTLYGIDMFVEFNGVMRKLQCKTYTTHEIVDGEHVFDNISNAHKYRGIELFSMYNDKQGIYIFVSYRLKPYRLVFSVENGCYRFPHGLLFMSNRKNEI